MSKRATTDERRSDERALIMAPVELRLWDEAGRHTLSESMHAVVTDASQGGLNVELVGPAARLFAEGKFIHPVITVTFLLAELYELGPLQCNLRWTRPMPSGWSLGLELVRREGQSQILRVLLSAPRRTRRTPAAVASGAALCALMALGGVGWRGWQETELLRSQVAELNNSLQQVNAAAATLRQGLSAAEVQAQHLRDEYAACQATRTGVTHTSPTRTAERATD